MKEATESPARSITNNNFLSNEAAAPPASSFDRRLFPLQTENYPYTIELNDVLKLRPGEYQERFSEGISFHTVGDTGGDGETGYASSINARERVVDGMKKGVSNKALAFFYHLGDVVYEVPKELPDQYARRYENQFYEPFKNYDKPIFAVPGSHDTQADYLQAFCDNFCNPNNQKKVIGDVQLVGEQPNFYWRLRMPFANIIGLSTNSPMKGDIDEQQTDWFVEMLKSCRRDDKALIVAMYYSPLDSEPGGGGSNGSPWLYRLTNEAYRKSKIFPHLVLSGHWHAYQRVNVTRQNGEQTVHVIAGCGGKEPLYGVTLPPNTSDRLFDGTTATMAKTFALEEVGSDLDRHGFMEISIDAQHITGRFISTDKDNTERDRFVINIRTRKIE